MNEHLQLFIVGSDTEILEIIKTIDANLNGIVYVCDHKKLKGTITDGDIRRYILKKKTIHGRAEEIMNPHPITIGLNDNCNKVKLMQEHAINSLPVIDDQKQLIDIVFLNKKTSRKASLKLPVVIMAGGKGSRLYPYTQILPKPLIPINDKTITEMIMDRFEAYDCTHFTMIVNYKKEFIKSYFKECEPQRDLTFIEESSYLGTAGGLKLLEGKIHSTFFMSNCDILIEDDYSEMVKYHKQKQNIITVICALKSETFPYGTLETDDNGMILSLKEKPTFEFLTNTGFYIIEPELLRLIPHNCFIHITEVLSMCMKNGYRCGVYPIKQEAWLDMGQLEELEKMRKLFHE